MYHWWGCKIVQPLWKTVWQFLKRLNIEGTIWPSNSTSRYISKRTENICQHKTLHMNVHSSLSHKSQKWKSAKCPSTGEWLSKMRCIYTMEYYSVIKKKNELPIHATIQTNLENIMLSERSQTQKATYYITLFI